MIRTVGSDDLLLSTVGSDDLLLSSASEFYICGLITEKEANPASSCSGFELADNCIVSKANELMNLDSNECLIPSDETRSAASMV